MTARISPFELLSLISFTSQRFDLALKLRNVYIQEGEPLKIVHNVNNTLYRINE